MTRKALQTGALLTALTLTPASADFITTSPDVVVDGWRMRSVQDSAQARQKWCQITAPASDKGYVFTLNLGQKAPVDSRVVLNEVLLGNANWDLGADSGGAVAVELSRETRTLDFRRRSATEAIATNLSSDEPTNGWLAGLTGGISARFPNGETFSVAKAADKVGAAALSCVIPLYQK